MAAPLMYLLKKDVFEWIDGTTQAFLALKEVLTTTPILAFPNFFSTFYLEIDASGSCVRVILSQDNHPIAYFSKKLSLRMQK